jgi:hypothetical protein
MMGDSLLVLVFDRRTMWKRIENDQAMCNNFVWIAGRLSGYLLWVITEKWVAQYLEPGYARFREEPIQVVSVREPQRFAGYGGVRLI